MIKKLRNSIFLAVFLLLGMSCNVLAEEIDPAKESSINLSYQYDEKVIANTTVSVYKIADIDRQGVYHYTGRFVDRTESLNDLSASETATLARKLAVYIEEEGIDFTYQGKTDSIGFYQIDGLTTGAYLIMTEDVVEDLKRYSVAPFFVSLPQANEEGSYEYDALVSVKVELTELEPSPTPTIVPSPTPSPTATPDNNTTQSPSTYDAIVVYVSIFAISIIGIGVVVYYIYKKKKGSKENEE